MLHATATVLATSTTASTSVLLTPNDIAALICMPLIVLFVVLLVKSRKKKKKQKEAFQEEKRRLGRLTSIAGYHVTGLPLPENTICTITNYEDRMELKAGTTEIRLQRTKITDVCMKTEEEIQKQVVSSIGGAVAGGLLFGPLGAAIGGRAKTKKLKTTHQYFIISYIGDNKELKYICFEIVDSNNTKDVYKVIEEFKERNVNSDVHIEL